MKKPEALKQPSLLSPTSAKKPGRIEDLAKIYMSMKYKSNPEPEPVPEPVPVQNPEVALDHSGQQHYPLPNPHYPTDGGVPIPPQHYHMPPPPPGMEHAHHFPNNNAMQPPFRPLPPPPPQQRQFQSEFSGAPVSYIGNNHRPHLQAPPPHPPGGSFFNNNGRQQHLHDFRMNQPLLHVGMGVPHQLPPAHHVIPPGEERQPGNFYPSQQQSNI